MPEDRDTRHAEETIEDLRTALKHLSGVFDQVLDGYKGFGSAGVALRDGAGELSAVVPTAKTSGYQLTISVVRLPHDS